MGSFSGSLQRGGDAGVIDSKTLVLELMREMGRREASELRKTAADMSGTEIIERERSIPAWSQNSDFTNWPKGAPVTDENQVWILITPHRAADYEGRPSTLRALWGLAHTTDPARAKPWVDPYGESGLYMRGECYITKEGVVKRCLQDNCVYDADAMPSYWEDVLIRSDGKAVS